VRAIAVLLVLGVFLRHDTAFRIADATGWSPGGIFYVSGALWEILLCALVLFFIWNYRASLWRSLGLAAMGIGIAEAAMSAACQMAITGRPPPNTTQCDFVTGLPVFAVTFAVEMAVLFWIVGRAWRKNGDGN
jgi:hypothetical protein